jgi:TRAP-type C4-dicarboxylate transport system permease large subunit
MQLKSSKIELGELGTDIGAFGSFVLLIAHGKMSKPVILPVIVKLGFDPIWFGVCWSR